MTQLRSVTCHMGSHICHPTQANTLRVNPRQTGRYSINLPTPGDGRLSWPRWLVTYRDGLLPTDGHPSK